MTIIENLFYKTQLLNPAINIIATQSEVKKLKLSKKWWQSN